MTAIDSRPVTDPPADAWPVAGPMPAAAVKCPADTGIGRPARRRRGARVVAGLLAVGTVAVLATRLTATPDAVVCGTDAVQAQALAGLADFSSWLDRYGVAGYVGEVGWPAGGSDLERWSAVADIWYQAADRVGLPVTAWAAGRWPSHYPMAVYRAAPGASALDTAGPQADVVERHGSDRRALRGVALASGSFGTSGDSPGYGAANPGRYGHDYTYENPDSYRYLARRGVRLVRLAIAWERIQPRPGGPLRAAEVGRLRRAVAEADAAGLSVVLDLHGYGQFSVGGAPRHPVGAWTPLSLGSAGLPTSALADLWSRLVRATRDLPGVLGYDLLNEPVRLAARGDAGARVWERASQEAVDAIRATGSRAPVFVAAYGRTSPTGWSRAHQRPWVRDPAGRAVYEVHVYFDADGSGRYTDSYPAELAAAATQGLPRCRRFPDLSDRQGRVVGRGPWCCGSLRLTARKRSPSSPIGPAAAGPGSAGGPQR